MEGDGGGEGWEVGCGGEEGTSLPVLEEEFVLVVDAEVPAGGDVSDTHRMEPVDVAARPFSPGQFQPPQRSGLGRDGTTLVHHNAGGATKCCDECRNIFFFSLYLSLAYLPLL